MFFNLKFNDIDFYQQNCIILANSKIRFSTCFLYTFDAIYFRMNFEIKQSLFAKIKFNKTK